MDHLKGLRVVVAGAGAVGSVLALRLARCGAQVVLADPAGVGVNASGVAAGMLAPLLESVLDPAAPDHYLLMRQARDAWPALAQSLPGAPVIDRSGAMLHTLEPEVLMASAQRLAARLEAVPRSALAFNWTGQGEWLFTPEDWRLDPRAMLPALHAAFETEGGARVAASVTGFEAGLATFQNAPSRAADVLVLATGAVDAWPAANRHLHPIKGQILRFAGMGPFSGPVIRAQGAYLVPNAAGLVVGATMEYGISDLSIDPVAVGQLRAAAADVYPHLADAPFTALAGVRAATPDGLPLVGAAGHNDILLARGARRNGWLLAPLMADVILEHLGSGVRSSLSAAFDPSRFG